MRKKTVMILALIMCTVFVLIGCGKQSNLPSVADNPEIASATDENQMQDESSDVSDQNITDEIIGAEDEESPKYYLKFSRGTDIFGDFEIEYDAYGNIVRRYNSFGTDTYEYEYDDNGRMVKKSSNEDDNVSITEYEYELDGNGNVIKESHTVNGEFRDWIEYEYDSNGNLLKQTQFYPTVATDDLVNWEEILQQDITEYNSFGKPAKYESYMGDELWTRDIYEYDENGKLTREESYSGETLKAIWEYEYDNDGNMIKKTYESRWVDPASITITEFVYKFDDNGNMIEEIEYTEDGGIYCSTEYEYELLK